VDQPPRYPRGGEPPSEEPFPRFDPALPGQPLGTRRTSGSHPYRGGGQPNPWLVGLAIAVVLAAISIIAFGLFTPEKGDGTTTTTTTTTGTSESTSTSGTTLAGSTTTTTTTPGGGGTTITLPGGGEALPITPVGDPIPITELTMASDGIGALTFGSDGDPVLGKLAATFGDPTKDTGFIVGDGSFGECTGDAIRVVQWGPLNVVVRGEAGNNTFISYRMDTRYGGINLAPTDMQTKSGLRVGDTVAQLKSIYAAFDISFSVDPSAGKVFELKPADGGSVLIWGPVQSEDDDALVTGIYSPNACQS
jgi:hypothetical protein